MIKVAQQKSKQIDTVSFQQLDLNNLNVISSEVEKSHKYNLIFSNFGGLNCLSKQELSAFFNNASKFLTENGKIIMVIMPKNCIWENKYLFFSGKWKQLFRRNTKNYLTVNVGNSVVKTWYYNPKEIVQLMNGNYIKTQLKPIGFYIPPSYLESFFKNKIWILTILNWMEKRIKDWSFLSRYSDHFIITLQKK